MNLFGRHYLKDIGTDQDKVILSYLLLVLFLLAFCVAGKMSFNDEMAAQSSYCEGVASKMHPDYKGIAAKSCPSPTR